MMWLTHEGLRDGPYCFEWDDLRILPYHCDRRELIKHKYVLQELCERQVIPGLAWPQEQLDYYPDLDDQIRIIQVYVWSPLCMYVSSHSYRQMPSWVDDLPTPLKASLYNEYSWNFGDESWIFPMPYTGINPIVLQDGLTENVFRLFGLNRLCKIRQLGWLHYPVYTKFTDEINEYVIKPNTTVLTGRYSHDRWKHSLYVMVITTLIGINNDLSEYELTHLRIAALTHDKLTPAGGDTTKIVDPKGLDEDANYALTFDMESWPEIQERWNIDTNLLLSIIANQGVLGKILDIADKIAYTSHDVYALVGMADMRENLALERLIYSYIQSYPFVCGVWDSIKVIGEQVVSTDPDRFANFLELRAQMFRRFYTHDAARFGEWAIASTVIGCMYDLGVLTKEQLLIMEDDHLDKEVGNFLGIEHYIPEFTGIAMHRSLFTTREEAQAKVRKLIAEGVVFVCIDDWSKPIKTGKDWPILENETIMPLSDARPLVGKRLYELSILERPFRVYWAYDERVSPEAEAKLMAWNKKRYLPHSS